MTVTDEQVRDAIHRLLDQREPPATICPSEVARALTAQGWRQLMPQVRDVAFAMAQAGTLEVRQGGRSIGPGVVPRGPIRLGRPMPPTEG